MDKWEPQLKLWQQLDTFGISYLQEIWRGMGKANQAIRQNITTAIQQKLRDKKSADQFAELLNQSVEKRSAETLQYISQMFTQHEIDPRLLTLLGCIQQNILVQERLESFISVYQAFTDLNLRDPEEVNSIDKIKNQLCTYSPNLKFIWQRLLELCSNVSERDLLRSVLEPPKEGDAKKSP
ncbi:MAG: hypothetical protein OXT67_12205 [Zetaproteobacteria bacterium]|nr:hypothetical protein [Zetaproteobacteria bacterium]